MLTLTSEENNRQRNNFPGKSEFANNEAVVRDKFDIITDEEAEAKPSSKKFADENDLILIVYGHEYRFFLNDIA